MLDIRFIRENAERVQQDALNKGYKNADIEAVIALDDERKTLTTKIDELRTRRNQIAASMKNAGGKPSAEQIAEGKKIKEELAVFEKDYRELDEKLTAALKGIPNILQPDVPIGEEGEDDLVKTWGEELFESRKNAEDHLDFANRKGWVDFERGSKVAGTKFYFLKGDLALLENAIYQFALNKLISKGFNFMTTAEMSLTGYHAGEILNEKDLPIFYAGYSPCYRKEAGTYGKHTRGLFRVHQFNKLEMYAYTLPEQSIEVHEKILAVEEEIYQELGIPYRVINIASGDLGAPASKKYDIEYWSPVDGKYREITSCSNCTDFQARNLNIRVRRSDGSLQVLHTLNGTAVSLARSLVAIIENYQTDDGKLRVPEVLRPYLGNREEL